MERFTKKDADGRYYIDGDMIFSDWGVPEKFKGEAADRLAAYEGTGIEPADVITAPNMAKIACALHELNQYKELGDIDRLRELAEADKDGRCFVSDVKLGGKVFYIPKFNGKPYCGIREGHVQAVSFTKVGKRIKIREYHAHNQDFMLGKTVFLTYEAAEAALKGETA